MATLRRRAILDSEKWAIRYMGRNGLHAGAIVEKLKRMGLGEFSRQQVYKVLRDDGISTLDYRDGANESAGTVFHRAFKGKPGASTQLPAKKQRSKRTVRKKRRR